MEERKTIYLCLAHMSEEGIEQKYVKEAFDTNWVVPMGPNVNEFEAELEKFVNRRKASPKSSPEGKDFGVHTADPMWYEILKKFSEENRNNPTEAENALWSALKAKGIGFKFRQQHIIEDFIVDFFCYEKKLTIELDGGYHNMPEQMKSDQERSARLKELGYTELRFTNEQVLCDFDNTIQIIKDKLSSLQGEDGGRLYKSLPSGGDLEEAPLDRKVVCLSAGTAAVHLALIACGVKAGDEVCVQSFTFCASSHPITYLGATPVFIDSEEDTWNMDPELLEKAIVDRFEKTGRYPKAIIPVALYGMPYRIDRIMEIAQKYGIPVIEDAAEGFGSRFDGKVLGTFGKYGVLSFNGNKMITTSGGGALICNDTVAKVRNEECGMRNETAEEAANQIMWYATQARDAYPYYEHTAIGYNYRMSNICAGIGRGQMTVAQQHIDHHKRVQALYEELLAEVKGVHIHKQPADGRFDSNYWLCTVTLDTDVKVVNQEMAYKKVITDAVGGAAGVIHAVDCPTTDCQPNDNVEAMRMYLDAAQIEARPVWKPMHKQPVYKGAPAYVNGVSEGVFKQGLCLPAGPCVSEEDVRYIVNCIVDAIER